MKTTYILHLYNYFFIKEYIKNKLCLFYLSTDLVVWYLILLLVHESIVYCSALSEGGNQVEPVGSSESISGDCAEVLSITELQTEVVDGSNNVTNPIGGSG